ILVALQKTFGTGQREIYCKQLEALSMNFPNWFKTYLEGIQQVVVANETSSKPETTYYNPRATDDGKQTYGRKSYTQSRAKPNMSWSTVKPYQKDEAMTRTRNPYAASAQIFAQYNCANRQNNCTNRPNNCANPVCTIMLALYCAKICA
ncbi:unnamed protein product, partial [Meganyctiphanes norvegica]